MRDNILTMLIHFIDMVSIHSNISPPTVSHLGETSPEYDLTIEFFVYVWIYSNC